jgi:hypothetical protein
VEDPLSGRAVGGLSGGTDLNRSPNRRRWRWTTLALIVLARGLAAGTGWLLVSVKPIVDEARSAVDGFHACYETGNYDSIYGSHVSLQESLTRADALARLSENTRPDGKR